MKTKCNKHTDLEIMRRLTTGVGCKEAQFPDEDIEFGSDGFWHSFWNVPFPCEYCVFKRKKRKLSVNFNQMTK